MLTTNEKQSVAVIILALIIIPTVFFLFHFQGLYLLILILTPLLWMVRYLNYTKAKKSTSWKMCSARIEKVKTVKGGSRYARQYFLKIIYAYSVMGEKYKGDRYSFLPSISLRNQQDKSSYTLGKYITVYYNPDKPSQSVEKPGTHESFFSLFWTFITLIPLTFTVLYYIFV